MKQERAIEIAIEGHNIFLTGKAGTGKTYTLNNMISALRKKGKNVAVTASTGIASTHIDGKTIHSWAGIGIKSALNEEDLYKLKNNKFSNSRIKSADVLIIDEISMLHDYRLDLVDEVLRFIKSNNQPFGGIQVILVGDFFQLPPVEKNGKTNYTFNSKIWEVADFKICYLDKIYRQANDTVFVDILNAVRENAVSDNHKEVLNSLKVNESYRDLAVNLYSKNIDVDKENHFKLDSLDTEMFEFEIRTSGNEIQVQNIIKNALNEKQKIYLKVGAHVMFNVNDSKGRFVNGTMGKVVDFNEDNGYPVVEIFKTGDEITVERHEYKAEEQDEFGKVIKTASVTQFPLRLAYAITIHKSQGCTFDYVNLDMSDVFVLNMGYVALSRITSLEGLWLKGYNMISLMTDQAVILKDQEFKTASSLLE